MRGAVGLRVMPRQLPAMAAPTLRGCGGAVIADWVAYAGATSYDVQWASGPDSNSPGPWTTLQSVASGVTVLDESLVAEGTWYFVRVRARVSGRATPWSDSSARTKAMPPPPPTASLSAGVGLAIAAPGVGLGADVYVGNRYDAQIQYAYSSTGAWSAFNEWYEVEATSGITYSQPPTGVWYRARIRYLGTNCSQPWTGEWGEWSTPVYAGPAEGGSGGEVGGD